MSLWSRLLGERQPTPVHVRARPPRLADLEAQLAATGYDVELQRIYADALIEEGGDHAIRGELIQLELTEPACDRRRELIDEVTRLRAARGVTGLGGASGVGLARSWDCSADQFARHAAVVFAEEPVLRWVTIQPSDVRRELGLVAGTPAFARVRCLSIVGKPSARLGEHGVATLLDSPYWPQHLEALQLANCRIRDGGAIRLANEPSLSGLEWLDLTSAAIEERGMLALARSPFLGKLSMLSLWQNLPGPVGIAALGAPENRMQLERLRLDKRQMFPAPVAAIRARYPGIEIDDREPAS